MQIGRKLGPYEIVSLLGAGGMGEVYTARDTRLNRNVALKVLPREFAADGQRRSRFETEAKAVAAHASGVTHRDLKPDNVMLTRDGRAKAGKCSMSTGRGGPLPL